MVLNNTKIGDLVYDEKGSLQKKFIDRYYPIIMLF